MVYLSISLILVIGVCRWCRVTSFVPQMAPFSPASNRLTEEYRPFAPLPLSSSPSSSSSRGTNKKSAAAVMNMKQKLLEMLEKVPRNTATPPEQTREILEQVRRLEPSCPTDPANVLAQSAGTWALIWTAQDPSNAPTSPFRWINPLENQAYSNNPQGRSNPVLPLDMQKALTAGGILSEDDRQQQQGQIPRNPGRISTQTIDLKNQRVINVVSLSLPQNTTAILTVRVNFTPYAADPRRVNVKFASFAVRWGSWLKLDWPLGLVGPTGWLQTTYLDDDLRITRGHKGSVFVLRRKSAVPDRKRR